MMTALDDIFAAAQMFASAEGGEEEMLRSLCVSAEQRLKKQLMAGVEISEIYESFVCAAGLLAAADFCCCRASGGVKSFSAGPVSVTKDDGETAKRLREQAALIMAPWCPDAFCFLGVKA